MASLQELITAWNTGPEEPLKEFYDEVFDGNTYQVDPNSSLPPEFIKPAEDMANVLNGIKNIFEEQRIVEEGTFGDTVYSLSGEDEYWPRFQNPDLEDAVGAVQSIVNSLLVLQENPLFYQPYLWDAAFLGFTTPGAQEPPSDLQELTEAVVAGAAGLLEVAGISVSLKPESPPPEETAGLGPAPIISDSELEASLSFASNKTHYVGFLLNADKSDGNRDQSYLPVRLSPDSPEESLPLGWASENYSLVDNAGNLVKPKNKDTDGIEIPLGLEIEVVEIVPSKTGVWVGFVSNDARLADLPIIVAGGAGPTLSRWDVITKNQTRLLYTKAQYVRIKESSIQTNPDPYLSERAMAGDDQAAATAGIEGTDPVSPKDNQNWITLRPNDVRLSYYSFNEHNLKIIAQGDEDELLYNENTLKDFPTLKYSEGYFYFILGEKPRKTEAELINESNEDLETSQDSLETAKAASGAETMASIKEEAWKKLLEYLGKNTDGGNSFLNQKLFEEYFVEVSKKLNTNNSNPNNQKVLYAIRASYIDSLPDVSRLYTEDFSPDSPYFSGNTAILSLPMAEIKKRCDYLVNNVLRPMKTKIESSGKTVENANGSDFDMDVQMLLMEDLPFILGSFFNRQSFPSSTNKSIIHDMVLEGINTTDTEHLVQIGIRDNSEVGGNVRQTVSYVLFSPNPEKLKDADKQDSDLYYIDPFLTKEELSGDSQLKRSGVPLRLALPWLRGELEGIYGSRALHLLLSYSKIKTKLDTSALDIQKDWPELMSNFFVPPVKIYHSKDPSLISPERLDCDDIIKKLNKVGPNSTLEERELMNKLYSSSECAEAYFNQFKDPTPAVSPGMSKQELEKKSEQADGKGGSILDNQYVKILYTGFFNSLDVQGMMGLIMACLESQAGIPITAEAICEAIIVKLIEDQGPGPVENVMLMNALLRPESEASKKYIEEYYEVKYGKLPPFAQDGTLVDPTDAEAVAEAIQNNVPSDPQNAGPPASVGGKASTDTSYNDAPIASTLAMTGKTKQSVTEKIKNMEKGGINIEFVPGPRPGGETTVDFPGSSLLPDDFSTTSTYTQEEIDNERRRLIRKGYSESQASAALVGAGYLVVNPQQYQNFLGEPSFSSPGDRFSAAFSLGALSSAAEPSIVEDLRETAQEAAAWLQQLKNVVGLVGVCELIVGQVLDGLQDLIKDPGAFFNGGLDNWFEDFKDSLKRQFSFKIPTMKFPDSLSTDSHMGNYGEQLLKTLVSMIAQMLGQIVRLILVNALEQCLEENNDVGALGKPSPTGPDIPFPVLERANLPRFDDVDPPDVVAWMKDVLDNLSTAQLCALLRGDATKQTLNNCLTRTREFWPAVYNSGIDTIYDIRVAFEKIGRDLDLDICDALESPVLVDNLCDAVFDRDARCQQLLGKGLTEAECEEQIDRELDNLRSKIAGLTSLSMLDLNPLSLSTPPICGEGGSFVIPPGVRDTMNRITDNMLTNVKGSLLIDMAGLKFFSTPPRALLALSDPNELKKAHQMFLDMAKDPYVKDCLALIGDPTHHLKHVAKGSGHLHELHPVTYNKYLHYGNFSTWNIRGDAGEVETLSNVDETTTIEITTGELTFEVEIKGTNAVTVDLDPKSEKIIRNTEPDENGLRPLQEDIKNYWKAASSNNDKLRSPDDFFNKSKLMPLHAGLFGATSGQGYLEEQVDSLSSIKTERRNTLKQYLTSFSSVEERVATVEKEYEKEIQSSILDILSIAPKDALNPFGLDAAAGSGAPLFVFPHTLNHDKFGSKNKINKYGATLRKVYSLDTKLKEISPDPNRWYIMMRNYTGVDISPYIKKGPAGHGGSQRFFPEAWLANAYINGEDLIGGALFDENNPQAFVDAFYKKIILSNEDLYGTIENIAMSEGLYTGTGVEGGSQLETKVEEALANLSNLHWLNWLKISPGLRNLVRIAIERQRKGENVEYEVPGLSPDLGDKKVGRRYAVGNHNLAFAFMELTVAEATGLEEGRLRSIFPAMSFNLSNSPGVIFNIDDNYETAVIKKINPDLDAGSTGQKILSKNDVLATVETGDTTDTAEGFYPHFLVFQKTFRDPDSPLENIDNFSLDKEKVNQELYDFFNFIPKAMLPGLRGTTEVKETISALADQQNFNPEALKYDLPFTEITAQTAPGIDGQGKVNEIMEVFATQGGEQLQELADSLQILQTPRSLVNQNIITPLDQNEASQLDAMKNISKLVKATVLDSSGYAVSGAIKNDIGLEQQIYNFDFAEELDPDVLTLIDDITGGEGLQGVLEKAQSIGTSLNQPSEDYTFETINMKSQIFGHLLMKKFNDLYSEYELVPGASGADMTVPDYNTDKLWESLVTHGYPALQYAYSTQMFAKLRESRLQERGFMKKLWKKILKSPLHSDSVDPRCQQVFDQIGAPSVQELDKTETDFFNVGEVKSKIIEFYEKSLCRDVYESNQEGIDSTRISLLEGMVKLVMKIYTLEMCLAAVIAWDSFNIEEVIKDSAFTSIIIQNISDDFNLEFISFYATDLLRKEESLTDIQLAELRQGLKGSRISSIEYLINKEAESISSIVKNIFTNSFPLSTDLTLSLVKNSDLDLSSSFTSLGWDKLLDFPASQYNLLSSEGDLEYVMDARIRNNIYSMNYGTGDVRNFRTGHNNDDAGNIGVSNFKENFDLYGLEFNNIGKQNKNYFQALAVRKSPVSGIGDAKTQTAAAEGLLFPTIGSSSKTKQQRDMLGFADAFSKEFTPEHTLGNELNAELGNISFQPFVHVVDYGKGESRNFVARVFEGTVGEPCELGTEGAFTNYDINDYVEEIDEMFEGYRTQDNNSFKCQFYSPGQARGVYVPLSVWSYYFTEVFLKELKQKQVSKNPMPGLVKLYEEFGLAPFFKKVSFGMRMTYTTAAEKIVTNDFGVWINGVPSDDHKDALDDLKTLVSRRMYYSSTNDQYTNNFVKTIKNELQIPIVEIMREIKSHEGMSTISVGESDAFPLFDLGLATAAGVTGYTAQNLLTSNNGKNYGRSLVNNPHQFFYKNLAQSMLTEIKNSAEFKLMFDYLFPMRRYMALATIVAMDGLSKFIPEPTTVLEKTKDSLQTIIENINSSTDYKQMPDAVANMMADFAVRSEAGTSGKEPDMTKEILKILYRTPLLVLKGFVEVTDPAIITAKRIIDISFAIQQATIAAAKQGLEESKRVAQAGIDAANTLMQKLEMNINMGLGLAGTTLTTIDATAQSLNWSSAPGGEQIIFSEAVKTDFSDIPYVGDWDFTIPANITNEQLAWLQTNHIDVYNQWQSFMENYTKLSQMAQDYAEQAEIAWPGNPKPSGNWNPDTYKDVSVPTSPGDLVLNKRAVEKEIEEVLRKAENTMKDLFTSPYLLPGMYGAMVPSVIPLGGGINPFPMPPPFMSTVPGMIYIALLLIDAIEEKMHDDQQSKLSSQPPNCIEQL